MAGKGQAMPSEEPFFAGAKVEEINPVFVQSFIEELPQSTKTKRHYREVFHHFCEFYSGCYQLANAHCGEYIFMGPTAWC